MKAILFVVAALLILSSPAIAVKKYAHPSKPYIVINLNSADVSTLTHSFKGIGKKRAEAIVAYREQHGNFRSVSELAEVKGLGKSFVTKNLSQLHKVFMV